MNGQLNLWLTSALGVEALANVAGPGHGCFVLTHVPLSSSRADSTSCRLVNWLVFSQDTSDASDAKYRIAEVHVYTAFNLAVDFSARSHRPHRGTATSAEKMCQLDRLI
jgi:hypothetical protein